MRKIFSLTGEVENEIIKASFFEPAKGFVAFTKWIAYTNDSGHSFIEKPITLTNVDFNGYPVNLTFGFGINGVKAFDVNNLLVYGDYGLVPTILSSSNGGETFKIIYHSQYDPLLLYGGITDIIFPENSFTGFAIDGDRILKTTDKGQHWSTVHNSPGSYFDYLEAVDNNTVFALSTSYSSNKALKTANGGITWESVYFPGKPDERMVYLHFRTASEGWMTTKGDGESGYVYHTLDGGSSWILINDPEYSSFTGRKIKFFSNLVGYGLYGQNRVYKTLNGGKTWEPIPRDNEIAYLGYSHNELFFWNNQQFWAGGANGLLEITTNGGGTLLPKAYFKPDTASLFLTNKVNLNNLSRTDYTYTWLLNKTVIGTSYNSSYLHDGNRLEDTITLIVNNGKSSDTITHYQRFNPVAIITKFIPESAAEGEEVIITGSNFYNVIQVDFGNTLAMAFSVLSPNSIKATVGSGSSGNITVYTETSKATKAGFVFIPPPIIKSFAPTSAVAGSTIIITGSGFNNATSLTFGGIPATSFTIVSATSISAIVPSGPSGSIAITTPGGSTNFDGYTAIPEISSFSPSSGTLGTLLVITGTSLDDISEVKIGGISASSVKINSSKSITATVSGGASGIVEVFKTNASAQKTGFKWLPAPDNIRFSPKTAPAGATITITGNNFNTIPTNNIVYFGKVKATITGGNSGSLTVIVPESATYEPISVTSNNLTSYSAAAFNLSFANGGSITSNTFSNLQIFKPGNNIAPFNAYTGDLDLDGKTDFIVQTYASETIENGTRVYRNLSVDNTVKFDAGQLLALNQTKPICLSDIDGDGKLDILSSSETDYGISVFRNTSTPGNISFANPEIFNIPFRTAADEVIDMDKDGKPDIAGFNQYYGQMSILKNTSNPGQISFAEQITIPFSGTGQQRLADLNNDGYPEIIIPHINENTIEVIRNISQPGQLKFEPGNTIPAGSANSIAIGDVDGDGLKDIVSANYYGAQIEVFRNNSIGNNFSFETQQQFRTGTNPLTVILNDIDGDGLPDIALTKNNFKLSVIKNVSQPGHIQLIDAVNYNEGSWYGITGLTAGDLNDDGKTDLIVSIETSREVSIYLNNAKPEPVILNVSPTIGVQGDQIIIKGKNFKTVSSVNFGGINTQSFTIQSDSVILAILGTGQEGYVELKNAYGVARKNGFAYGLAPTINSFTPSNGVVGSVIKVTGKHFSTNLAENLIEIGGMHTTAIEGSDSTLNFKVPANGRPDYFTITVNGKSAYSPKAFGVTLSQPITNFKDSSFAIPYQMDYVNALRLDDLNKDGQLDMIVYDYKIDSKILLNRSDCKTFRFDTQPLPALTPGDILLNAIGDLDGDGNNDLISHNKNNGTLGFMLNGFKNGTYTYETSSFINDDFLYNDVGTTIIHDLDADGKPEIIFSSYSSNMVIIYKNISTKGQIKFSKHENNYGFIGYATSVSIGDIDGDNKPELLAVVNGPNQIQVFKNLSTPGTIIFGNSINFTVNGWPSDAKLSDLDGDGKLDIIASNATSNNVSILRNISTINQIQMAAKIDFSTGNLPYSVKAGDLTGDGKTDLVIFSTDRPNVTVLINSSSIGAIQFNQAIKYDIGKESSWGELADMNGDGIMDIICNQQVTLTTIIPIIDHNKTASIVINGKTNVNKNDSSLLKASTFNSGNFPTYQWQDSTLTRNWADIAGATADTLKYVPAITGVKVRCKLIPQDSCLNYIREWSNSLTFNVTIPDTVDIPTALEPVPIANFGIRVYPNPAITYLTLDSLNLNDRWEVLSIYGLDGRKVKEKRNFKNLRKVTISVEDLSDGMYIAVLRKSDGFSVFFRFLKE